jgi:hypothetical protein
MRFTRTLAGLSAAAFLSAGGLAAAQAPPAPDQSASQPSPERKALAHELVAASGGEKQLTQVLQAMFNSINTVALRNLPPAQQRLQSAIQNELQTQVIALAPQLMDMTANIYAENLSDKELRDYMAWLRSDSGQSIREKLPVITSKSMQATLPLLMATLPKVVKTVIDRACDEAHCTAQDRQVIAEAMAKSMPKQPS